MKIEPNEPNAVLLMGQAYKAMGQLAQAVQMMTISRDLDPKNRQKINQMIETFNAEGAKTTSGTLDGKRGVSGRGRNHRSGGNGCVTIAQGDPSQAGIKRVANSWWFLLG